MGKVLLLARSLASPLGSNHDLCNLRYMFDRPAVEGDAAIGLTCILNAGIRSQRSSPAVKFLESNDSTENAENGVGAPGSGESLVRNGGSGHRARPPLPPAITGGRREP